MKIAILSRNAVAVLDLAAQGGGRGARPRGPGHRLPALLHEHHVAPAGGDLPGQRARRLRRHDPAHRRLAHVLRHGRGAAVRDDGRRSPPTSRRRSAAPRDKLRCLQLLARDGIGLPVTGFAHSTKDIDGLLDTVGGAPLVVKLLEGTQGVGVVLAETKQGGRVGDRGLPRSSTPTSWCRSSSRRPAAPTSARSWSATGWSAAMQRQARARRVPLEPAPRRHRREGSGSRPRSAAVAVRAARTMGLERRRRRHAALQPRPGGDGGQLARRGSKASREPRASTSPARSSSSSRRARQPPPADPHPGLTGHRAPQPRRPQRAGHDRRRHRRPRARAAGRAPGRRSCRPARRCRCRSWSSHGRGRGPRLWLVGGRARRRAQRRRDHPPGARGAPAPPAGGDAHRRADRQRLRLLNESRVPARPPRPQPLVPGLGQRGRSARSSPTCS